MSPDFETITLDIDGWIAELTLTRPELLNRIDDQAHDELTDAFQRIAAREDLRAIVFAAEGQVFSAGGDFDTMIEANQDHEARRRLILAAEQLLEAVLHVRAPIVVALHGDAFGVAATLVMHCDAVVAYERARIGDPHVRVGLVAGDGGCVAWSATVGMVRAKRHLLTGEPLEASIGYQLGMVTDLVSEPSEALPEARRLAAQIASLPPMAVQGTKRVLNTMLRQSHSTYGALGFTEELMSLGSEDLAEAVRAFRERRPGNYRNR